ncbi:hypothetical protein OJ996_09090 [Luteolibacter sp. GHJ8]|uniref:Uncharacterized protein n=1 Tax=Luteolibacter rhizosphaerae TaxID=2989719 RepID=A0ABT3G1M2_9BACT|nr:hypothetical protein [Luteolibacter rhizosphaerae]MCW1913728.1 hypothetical protein [Luteolibacter rhizosphaerae]
MSVKVSISIDAAAPKARLEVVQKVAKDRAKTNAVIGEAVAALARQRIHDRYVVEETRTNFWERVQNSIESEADENGATITYNELGIGLRYRGGTVTPGKSISTFTGKLTRALAIPSDKVPLVNKRPVAPRYAGLLAFLRSTTRGDTVGVLVEGQQKVITRGPNKGKTRIVPKPGGDLLYVLKKMTRHRPDPQILPDESAIQAAGQAAIQRLLFAGGQ